MQKTFVLAVDDLLNDFSKKLRAFDREQCNKNDPALREFLYDMKNGRLTDAGQQIMGTAKPDADGIRFTEWLAQSGFTVFLCTDRDLRIAYHETEKWLKMQRTRYDGLFAADDPIEFCQQIGAQYFLFGMPDRETAPESRLKLFCFSATEAKNSAYAGQTIDFENIGGVKRWIQKSNC
jgi:hypothetical protein